MPITYQTGKLKTKLTNYLLFFNMYDKSTNFLKF